MLWFLGRLAPFLCAIVYFKLTLAPLNDINEGQGTGGILLLMFLIFSLFT